jgi:hypothetical protein
VEEVVHLLGLQYWQLPRTEVRVLVTGLPQTSHTQGAMAGLPEGKASSLECAVRLAMADHRHQQQRP